MGGGGGTPTAELKDKIEKSGAGKETFRREKLEMWKVEREGWGGRGFNEGRKDHGFGFGMI